MRIDENQFAENYSIPQTFRRASGVERATACTIHLFKLSLLMQIVPYHLSSHAKFSPDDVYLSSLRKALNCYVSTFNPQM